MTDKSEQSPKCIKIHSLGRREVRVTKGGLDNGYISLSAIKDFFPPAAVGGSKKVSIAPKLLTLVFECRSFRSDIDGGEKWIIRNRGRYGMRGFLGLTKAKAGDVVVIDKLADYVYALHLKRRTLA